MRFLSTLLLFSVVLSSCVKQEFDEPVTANIDPNLTVTHTLTQLTAMANAGATPVQITQDVIVSGVVIADDESGNFYKEIIIQDDSGTRGLGIKIDVSNFNSDYPQGRRIFIKCKGLYIANDDGNYAIGMENAGEIGRIPAALVEQYIVKGKWGITITPKIYALNSNSIPTNTLVQFNGVEFDVSDAGRPFSTTTSFNRELKDCSTIPNTLVLYTSSFADFATTLTPLGNGTIVGVYKLYNGDGELIIRNLNDVNMDGVRCDSTSGQASLMPIDSLRMLFTGSQTTAPFGKKIKGTVISDRANGNLNGRNCIIQDGTAGILVRFTSNHVFSLGQEIEVNISGIELSEFAGVLQVNNTPNANATVTGSGSVTPQVMTIAQINSNYDALESTLVKIDNVTISGTGTYQGNVGNNTLNDGTGSIVLYTASTASFVNNSYPTGTVSITGILTEYNGTKEVIIRNTSDVQ